MKDTLDRTAVDYAVANGPDIYETVVEDGEAFRTISINTAGVEELQSFWNVGPSRARKIIKYREENGPFETLEEIQNVQGIGPVTLKKTELIRLK